MSQQKYYILSACVHKRKIQTDEKQTISGINILKTCKSKFFLICCVRVYLPKTSKECERDDDEKVVLKVEM
jgi:hypothetical protein